MTSPYLNRPVRSLKDALNERGLSATDFGIDANSAGAPAEEVSIRSIKSPRRTLRILVISVLLGALSSIAIYKFAIDSSGTSIVAEDGPGNLDEQAKRLNDSIIPAAGNGGR